MDDELDGPDQVDALRQAEDRLQRAMRASDVPALDALLHEDVVYVAPDGSMADRAADLDAHRTHAVRLERIEELAADVVVSGTTGVTRVLLALTGTAGGQDVSVTYRYTRTWVAGPTGWRVLAAHASALP